MERFLATKFLPQLLYSGAFGPNQFAYRPKHGARDAILFLVMSWLTLLANGNRIGVYCSDVSGAFDRVSARRLLSRFRLLRVHPRFLRLFDSWLQARLAKVIVAGTSSQEFVMTDMVYQGTVWGPSFWNIFIAEASQVLRNLLYEEIFYADDLNAFKGFASEIDNHMILLANPSFFESQIPASGSQHQSI